MVLVHFFALIPLPLHLGQDLLSSLPYPWQRSHVTSTSIGPKAVNSPLPLQLSQSGWGRLSSLESSEAAWEGRDEPELLDNLESLELARELAHFGGWSGGREI